MRLWRFHDIFCLIFYFNFQVTQDEASHCLLPFFERFLDLEKFSELNPKMAIIIERTMTGFFNEQVESFVEELEEIALDPEVTFNHDHEDSIIPTGPRAPSPLKEEKDL